MKKIILNLCFTISTIFSFGQKPPPEYYVLIKKADSLFKVEDYKNSAPAYSEAFKINEWKAIIIDRYRAASTWALMNNQDSAFYHLNLLAVKAKYSYYLETSVDPNFISLYNDPRWSLLIEQIKQNRDLRDSMYDKAFVAKLDSIYIDDQKFRKQLEKTEKKYGSESNEVKTLWKIVKEKDSVNQLKVTSILDKYGWLGTDVVGRSGSSTLFIVIQHSEIGMQEKYLPMMREAVKNGLANSGGLALLEDRIAIKQGKKQIYGSQIRRDSVSQAYYVLPLEDPDNVDKRRAEVNLVPMAQYLQTWKIKWDVEQYKKDLPAIEAMERARKK